MKKVIMVVVLLGILGSLAVVPMLGHAKATDCVQPTAKPTPRTGGEVYQDNPDAPGKIWVDSAHSEAGITGPHGFLRVDAARPQVYGYQTDSGINGKLDPNGATAVCVSVADNKITVP